MGRPINDARADSRGRARIPIVRGSERRIGGATNPRTAATRVGVYDCGLAAWTFSELVVIYHRVWLGSDHPFYPSAANAGFLLFPVSR